MAKTFSYALRTLLYGITGPIWGSVSTGLLDFKMKLPLVKCLFLMLSIFRITRLWPVYTITCMLKHHLQWFNIQTCSGE